jgi:2-polyprenyl-6-methoxyphenol hydroxylase-like FAD-dependent oxidoreductase
MLIVGAGPVGLSLAIELARHGARADIIDAALEPSPFCRAIGVSPRTLEIFESMGVAQDIIAAGLQITGRRAIIHRGADPIVHDEVIDLRDLPYSHYGVPQNRTEAVLQQKLTHLGIEVERGCRLAGLEETADGVTVELERKGHIERRRYDYAVGCDGAHSAVRKALGLAFDGDAFPYDFMLGDVAIDWDLPRGMTLQAIRPAIDAAPDFFVAIPLPERGRYRVSMMAPLPPGNPPGTEVAHGIQLERPGATLAQLQEVANRLVPGQPVLSDMRWSSLFRISMRLVARYRSGNVLLAGDACHIHPPTGGQGMNTGIQDACNLAWKLALVSRGLASASLLDSYEAERRPVAAGVIEDTVRRSLSLGKPAEPPNRLHDTQMLVSYAGGPLARGEAGGTLKPGDRLPDIQGLRHRGMGFPLRLFDLVRGPRFTILAFPDTEDFGRLETIAAGLAATWSGVFATVAFLRAGQTWNDPPGIAVVEDANDAMRALFDGAAPSLILLRPDGYIGFMGAMAEAPVLEYLQSVVGFHQ